MSGLTLPIVIGSEEVYSVFVEDWRFSAEFSRVWKEGLDLTSSTVTLLVRDKLPDGTLSDPARELSMVVDPDQAANKGRCYRSIADGDFSVGTMVLRLKIESGGRPYYSQKWEEVGEAP